MDSTIRLACVLSLLAPPAVAQVTDTSRQAPRDTTARRPTELAPIEVTGSIAPVAGPTIGSGIPARISTVTGQEIEAWEPRIVTEALISQAGISTFDDLGSPYKVSMSTRGFAVGPVVGLPQGVSVFLDGVRQNEPDASEVYFDLLPMEHVQRVELLSGTASLLGPNSLGGAINLITNRGGGPLTAELELTGGSFGSYSGEGSASGALKGWNYYGGGGYANEDGWRTATDAKNYNLFANVGRRAKDRGVFLQAFGAKSRAETAGSLPEALFDSDPKTNFTPGDFEDIHGFQVALSGYRPIGPGRGAATAYFRSTNAERFNVNQAPDPDVRSFSDNRVFGGNVDWRWTHSLGRGALSLRAGIDGAVNRVHVQIFTEAPSEPNERTLTTDVHSPGWDAAGYAIADWNIGRFVFSGGLRYDHIRIPFQDALDPSADTTNTFDRVSPRGGVSFQLNGGASLYASVGQSFRAPSLVELTCADETAPCPLPFALGDDPPLDPVIATTYEIGGRLVRGTAIFDASAYRTNVRNDIFFIASDAALFEGFFQNIGDTRREGVEVSGRFAFSEAYTGYVNYAYTLATFQTEAEIFSPREEAPITSPIFGENEVEPGDELPLVPNHQIRAGALADVGHGLHLGAQFRYIGPQWLRGDEANETTRLSDYATLDLRLGWEFGPWEVSGILTNVFDASYATFGTFNENRETGEIERFLTPGLPRAVKFIVQRNF